MIFRRQPRILLSYRRADTEATAGRLADHLKNRFGSRNVFIDIDNIPHGSDFREYIISTIKKCDVVIALIGKRWTGAESRIRRIDEHEDHLRIEIETALRSGTIVIPVLVDEAKMPTSTELPSSISQICYLNAARLRTGPDFHHHINILCKSIQDASARDSAPLKWLAARSSIFAIPLISVWQYYLIYLVVSMVMKIDFIPIASKAFWSTFGINGIDGLYCTGALIYLIINTVLCLYLKYCTKFRVSIEAVASSIILTIAYFTYLNSIPKSYIDWFIFTCIVMCNLLPMLIIRSTRFADLKQ